MPIETVPGTAIAYDLIAYDAQGREQQDDPGGLMSGRALDCLKDSSVTDVFLLSHGWRGDVPAARAQYNRWIGAMAGCSADIGRMKEKRLGFRPLIIALRWPSEPWGDDTFAGASSFDTAGAYPVEELVSEIAANTVDIPVARAALRGKQRGGEPTENVDDCGPGLYHTGIGISRARQVSRLGRV